VRSTLLGVSGLNVQQHAMEVVVGDTETVLIGLISFVGISGSHRLVTLNPAGEEVSRIKWHQIADLHDDLNNYNYQNALCSFFCSVISANCCC